MTKKIDTDTNTEIALSVQNVTKTFKLPHERHSGLKSAIVSTVGGKYRRGYEQQKVLNRISFDVKKGEFFGIVGRNGSGKSTLLKLMAGIYAPDSGKIVVSGSLTPFIELGVGFNPELTGLENIYLNGALLGFSRKEMEAKYDDIVGFAELEDFMDQKLKNYSSGMQVRLAFAIAIQSASDILILDEVLAVGDEAFQRKCFKYFSDVKQQQKTVILVSHNMDSVQQFCDRAMLIERGEIVDIGAPVDIARQYSELFITTKKVNKETGVEEKEVAQNKSFDVNADVEKNDEKVRLSFAVKPLVDFDDPVVGVYMSRSSGDIVWRWSSDDETPTNNDVSVLLEKGKTLNLQIELENILPSDSFTATLLVRKADKSEEYARFSNIVSFENYNSSLYRKFWRINEAVKASNDE